MWEYDKAQWGNLSGSVTSGSSDGQINTSYVNFPISFTKFCNLGKDSIPYTNNKNQENGSATFVLSGIKITASPQKVLDWGEYKIYPSTTSIKFNYIAIGV